MNFWVHTSVPGSSEAAWCYSRLDMRTQVQTDTWGRYTLALWRGGGAEPLRWFCDGGDLLVLLAAEGHSLEGFCWDASEPEKLSDPAEIHRWGVWRRGVLQDSELWTQEDSCPLSWGTTLSNWSVQMYRPHRPSITYLPLLAPLGITEVL